MTPDPAEDGFQSRLDADPNDDWTRLVLADWLDERGDPRAAGYRVLAALKRRPRKSGLRFGYIWTHWGEESQLAFVVKNGSEACLPWDWERLCPDTYGSRRGAEDAAAYAFAGLGEERRSEIARGPDASLAGRETPRGNDDQAGTQAVV